LEKEKNPGSRFDPFLFDFAGSIFTGSKKVRSRTGIIAAVRLSEFSKGEILPHERTLEAPIQDRYRLMSELKMNESPVFFVCRDREQRFEELLTRLTQVQPNIEFQNLDEPILHRIWKIVDSKTMTQIQNLLQQEKLLIADGHHRYETSQRYAKNYPGASTEWVLGYIASANSRKCGARIYSSIDFVEYSTENLLQKLKETFYLKSLPTSWEGYVSSEAPLALVGNDQMHLLFEKGEIGGDLWSFAKCNFK